jgi:hypothetical protein
VFLLNEFFFNEEQTDQKETFSLLCLLKRGFFPGCRQTSGVFVMAKTLQMLDFQRYHEIKRNVDSKEQALPKD